VEVRWGMILEEDSYDNTKESGNFRHNFNLSKLTRNDIVFFFGERPRWTVTT
jgi:hypothetical protein